MSALQLDEGLGLDDHALARRRPRPAPSCRPGTPPRRGRPAARCRSTSVGATAGTGALPPLRRTTSSSSSSIRSASAATWVFSRATLVVRPAGGRLEEERTAARQPDRTGHEPVRRVVEEHLTGHVLSPLVTSTGNGHRTGRTRPARRAAALHGASTLLRAAITAAPVAAADHGVLAAVARSPARAAPGTPNSPVSPRRSRNGRSAV